MKKFQSIREFIKNPPKGVPKSKRVGDPLFRKAVAKAFDKFDEFGGTDFRNNPQKTKKFIDFVNKEYKKLGGKHEELTHEEMINEIMKLKEDGHGDVISMKNKVGVAMKALETMKTELDKLGDNDNLPTWWTNKVATAVSSLDGMADYLDVKVEETELDENYKILGRTQNYKYEGGKIKISKQNYQKVNKDYKSMIKGKPFMLTLDPKGQFSILAPVVFEEVELDESLKTTHVVIDTSKNNEVVGSASDEKNIKQVYNDTARHTKKSVLKIVKLKRPVGAKKADKLFGYPLRMWEEVELKSLDEIIQANIRYKPEVKKAEAELIKTIQAYVYIPISANESAIDKSFKKLKDVIKKLKGKTRTEEDEKIFEELLEETKQLIQETKDPFKYDHSIYGRFKDTAPRKPYFNRLPADEMITENGSAPKEILDLFVKRMNQANKRDPESVEYVVVKGFKPNILIKGK